MYCYLLILQPIHCNRLLIAGNSDLNLEGKLARKETHQVVKLEVKFVKYFIQQQIAVEYTTPPFVHNTSQRKLPNRFRDTENKGKQ